ncbi:MAG: tRNA (adenosine(37)-N6)-dimethylallyltransferase MiaA [Myxococcales bacterium]|nr:tRNA (adenosine(37)-N6)-dimethylallyltransferase MiaA [Myxococcales bacterium]
MPRGAAGRRLHYRNRCARPAAGNGRGRSGGLLPARAARRAEGALRRGGPLVSPLVTPTSHDALRSHSGAEPNGSGPAARIAVLAGPTGCGKTAAAVALRALHGLPVEVIGFDALQLYRGLDAATAKPSAAERAAVPCHAMDALDPTETCSAGRWVALAQAAIVDVHARRAWPLLVGGTGLYLRALLEGLAAIPPTPPELRAELAARWHDVGADRLHAQLAAVDPAYAARTPATNRQRVLRALEVWHATGRSFSDWHASGRRGFDGAVYVAVVEPEPAALRARLHTRAATMAAPLLAEVRDLLAAGLDPAAPGLQALGYRDAVALLRGGAAGPRDESLPAAAVASLADRLAHLHVQYARRQRTWYRAQRADVRLGELDRAAVQRLAGAVAGFWREA